MLLANHSVLSVDCHSMLYLFFDHNILTSNGYRSGGRKNIHKDPLLTHQFLNGDRSNSIYLSEIPPPKTIPTWHLLLFTFAPQRKYKICVNVSTFKILGRRFGEERSYLFIEGWRLLSGKWKKKNWFKVKVKSYWQDVGRYIHKGKGEEEKKKKILT